MLRTPNNLMEPSKRKSERRTQIDYYCAKSFIAQNMSNILYLIFIIMIIIFILVSIILVST